MALVPKAALKVKLILVAIVAVLSIYSVVAYRKEFFPFTKENKDKIQKLIKGKSKEYDDGEADALERQIRDELAAKGEDLGLGGVDEYGSLEEPRGGTGARPLGSGSLSNPMIKGDEQMTKSYQQELFRQLFLPYEQYPGFYDEQTGAGNLTPRFQQIARGGDLPRRGEITSNPLQYPYPVDERMYELYGLYPPGGTYREELGDEYYANTARRINAMYADDRRMKMRKTTIRNKRAYLGDTITPSQKQFAFSRLQKKATKMNQLNDPLIVRRGNLSNVLPPVVARRHLATEIRMS